MTRSPGHVWVTSTAAERGSAQCAHFKQQWALPPAAVTEEERLALVDRKTALRICAALSRDEMRRLFRRVFGEIALVLGAGEFFYVYRYSSLRILLTIGPALSPVISLLSGAGKTTFRKLAVDSVALIVHEEPSLLEGQRLMSAITNRLDDQAISVRDSAIKLVGKCVRCCHFSRSFARSLSLSLCALLCCAVISCAHSPLWSSPLLSPPLLSSPLLPPSPALLAVRQQSTRYVARTPSLIAKFHAAIAEKMKDVGVSVRKSALRIQSDILLTNPEHELRTEICCKLIDSVTILGEQEEDRGEEERKMALDLFQQLWFCALPKSGAESSNGEGEGDDSALEDESSLAGEVTRRAVRRVVRRTAPAKGRGKAPASSSSASASTSTSTTATPTRGGGTVDAEDRVTTSLKQRVQEIITVVQHCRSTSWLQELLHSIFLPEHGAVAAIAAAEKDARKTPALTAKKQYEAERRATAKQICVDLVDALVLCAREAIGDDPDEDEAGAAGRRGLACLQALGVFSAVSPALLARHVDTLGVYLVPSTARVRDKQLCLIITLITRALPLLARPDPEYLRAISERLRSLIASCGVKVMERSARCMGLLATMMPEVRDLEFYRYVHFVRIRLTGIRLAPPNISVTT